MWMKSKIITDKIRISFGKVEGYMLTGWQWTYDNKRIYTNEARRLRDLLGKER